MGIEDRIERLRQVYGPPPIDPIEHSRWEHRNALMAALPDVVADLISRHGTRCAEVDQAFGALAPAIVGEVVWRDLQCRTSNANTYHVALEVVGTYELCGVALFGWSDNRRIDLAEHLSRVAVRQMAFVVTSHPTYRGLFDELS